MADERKIVIELKATGSGSDKSSKSEESDLTDALKNLQHPIQSMEKATLGKNVLVYRTYQQAKALLKDTTIYAVRKYFNLTENYKAEQDLNNTLSVLSNLASAGTSILGGAIAGAKVSGGNPYVAAAGAVVGFTTWGINTGLNAAKSWDQQHMQLTTMNIQSEFQQVRLGLIDNGRGTQN